MHYNIDAPLEEPVTLDDALKEEIAKELPLPTDNKPEEPKEEPTNDCYDI